jgi:hypothetical protein
MLHPMTAARKIEPPLPAELEEAEEGFEIPPEDEEWFDQMMAETDEQIRRGELIPAEEVLARFRTA